MPKLKPEKLIFRKINFQIARKIAFRRKSLGIHYKTLIEKMGVSNFRYQSFEEGKINLTVHELALIAHLLNTSIDFFLDDKIFNEFVTDLELHDIHTLNTNAYSVTENELEDFLTMFCRIHDPALRKEIFEEIKRYVKISKKSKRIFKRYEITPPDYIELL